MHRVYRAVETAYNALRFEESKHRTHSESSLLDMVSIIPRRGSPAGIEISPVDETLFYQRFHNGFPSFADFNSQAGQRMSIVEYRSRCKVHALQQYEKALEKRKRDLQRKRS